MRAMMHIIIILAIAVATSEVLIRGMEKADRARARRRREDGLGGIRFDSGSGNSRAPRRGVDGAHTLKGERTNGQA
jgi:hypothetical protein